MKPLVLVPALNEEASIASVVRSLKNQDYDVLVVSDGSTDRTSEIAEREGALVLRLPINLGVGGALRAGFRFAVQNGYEAVVQVDADGQHPVDQITDLCHVAMNQDAHLVVGSRYLSEDSTLIPSTARRFSMTVLAKVASRLTRVQLTDTTSGFRIIREPLLTAFADSFPDYYLGDTFEATVAAARSGYRVQEVPAALAPRLHGESSASIVQSIRLIAKVLLVTILRLHPPIKSFD